MLAKPLRVSLPGEYQRIYYDGSLGEPVRYIELGGYEGVVLKKKSLGPMLVWLALISSA